MAEKNAIMDQIEKTVKLPGDFPLSSYFRTYIYSENGEVVATYLHAATPEYAGKRRWLDPEGPRVRYADGGCGVINIRYQPATKKITSVYCNGHA